MSPSSHTRVLRIALAGGMIEPLVRLLEDVIVDSGVRYEFTSLPDPCDVVLVMVNWGDELRVIANARAQAGGVPLLALLPFGDDELAQRVLFAGAQGWFALDTPMALLRTALARLADLCSTVDGEAA